jgi:hypothetical protein
MLPGAACFPVVVRALAAAMAGAAVLAGAAAAAPVIEEVQASASASAATLTWRTSLPTSGLVAYGVGGLYLWSAREDAASTAHAVTLPDLSPSTTYEFRIVAAAASAAGSFTTAARADGLRFGVDGTHVTADGSLFFPVLSYEQCADTVDRALAIGVNTFVQVPFTACSTPADVTPPYVLSDDYAAGRGIGWYLPDEPDGWGITPEQMPRLPPAAETGRLRLVNLTQHFFSGQAPINDRFDRNDYKQYAALGDVIGFDMYPVVKFCGRIPLLDVFRAQRELMTIYAPGKPTYQWIETSRMTGECSAMRITPEIVNAEAWLAVAGGACGLGLFTNSWTGALWNRWDFEADIEQQLEKTVAWVQRLAPALCTGEYGSVVVPWDGSVAASSRTLNGALYVIAVNGASTPTTVPFRVDGLAGRTLSVLDEGRTIGPAKQVFFRDRFAPYEVHVYVAPPR